jgi:glycosyltransferase involved in cell wall biosynthesis
MRRSVDEWKPDVIHIQFAIAAFGSRTLGLIRWIKKSRHSLGVPIVVTLHELARESSLLPLVSRPLFRWMATSCDHTIVHTRSALHIMVDDLGVPQANISLIPHPSAQPSSTGACPDELRDRFGLGGARVLLSFGFIHVDKGLSDLVTALDILRATRPSLLENVRLVVAGEVRPRQGAFRIFELRDRFYLRHILRRVKRSSLSDVIVMTGYVPAGDIATWFNIADAVVLPYRHIEHSGVASLALSFDVAVLASTVGDLSELFGHSPWTFPARAPARLAAALGDFLASASADRAAAPTRWPDDPAAVADRTLKVYRLVKARPTDPALA